MSAALELLSRRPQAAQTVVIFPHAGGSPRFYRHWPEAMAQAQVVGVTYPGRDRRIEDPFPPSLAALADDVAAELTGQQELVLFGHSMGAVVAYEVAHRLLERSVLSTLVVSGHDAPTRPPVARTQLHQRPNDELVADLVRLDPRNAEVFSIPELNELFLPVVRNDYRLVETYEPSRQPDSLPRIAVINGDTDPDVTVAGAQAWQDHADEFLGVQFVPGGHFHHAAPALDCARLVARIGQRVAAGQDLKAATRPNPRSGVTWR